MTNDTEARKAFEEWFEVSATPLEDTNWFQRDDYGDYSFYYVECAWEGYQAGRESRQPEIDRLREALKVFDEAMRNGSIGPDAEKHKSRALRAAHKKAKQALNQEDKS